MAALGVNGAPLDWYLDLRRFGGVPHAGPFFFLLVCVCAFLCVVHTHKRKYICMRVFNVCVCVCAYIIHTYLQCLCVCVRTSFV